MLAREISIGQFQSQNDSAFQILCDDTDLARHINQPYFRAYVTQHLGKKQLGNVSAPRGPATVNHSDLARHTCICGASGSGKTRLALHLLAEQLRSGCSVVMLDPKEETIRHMLQIAHSVGIAPEDVTLLQPNNLASGVPGWNPLSGAGGVPPDQAAADVVSILASSARDSWGPRLQDLLMNALIVMAAHRLSMFELARFLQRDEYREGLLLQPPLRNTLADPETYAEALHYFRREFARMSPSDRITATGPVINKFRELLRSPFLRGVLCTRRTTLSLASLWQRRSLVLVHLDNATLGDEGTRLLGGLLAHQLYQTCMRSSGPVPVALCLDEMGIAEGFIGDAATKILAIARSKNLRLLVACQHLAQLSDGLRAALLGNTAVRAFFRLGYDDARLVSSWLAAGTGERLEAVRVEGPSRKNREDDRDWTSQSHIIRDGYGTPLELSGPAWTAFDGFSQNAAGDRQLTALGQLSAVSGVGRLYVHAPDTENPVELNRYVKGLRAEDYEIMGPSPMKLEISFLRPRLSGIERETETERSQAWLRTLLELPVQQAVLRGASGQAGIAKIASVSNPPLTTPFYEYQAKVVKQGQSAPAVLATLEWRKGEVERLATLGEHALMERTTARKSGAAPTSDQKASPSYPKAGSGTARPSPAPAPASRPQTPSSAKPTPQPHSTSHSVAPSRSTEAKPTQEKSTQEKPKEVRKKANIAEDGSLA